MPVTFTTNAPNSTVSFAYTAPTLKLKAVLEDAAHKLFNMGRGDHGTKESPIVWGDLADQEKLNILQKHIKDIVSGMAKQYIIDTDLDVARAQAIADSSSEHDLG